LLSQRAMHVSESTSVSHDDVRVQSGLQRSEVVAADAEEDDDPDPAAVNPAGLLFEDSPPEHPAAKIKATANEAIAKVAPTET
jgi:hypothetical protein